MTDDSALDALSNIIDEAFDKVFGRGNDIKETKPAPKEELTPTTPALYESIEDYTAKTGKRFRMTKTQKELGMTREEAFKLTYGEY
jgi:hypothetical protein|tara:strand:+ start:437 stop:694 length:258 start_codon:yes stop_codon:yes gene_type:complete